MYYISIVLEGLVYRNACFHACEASHPDGLVVFGHSIGAWIALQHLKEAKSKPPLLVLAMPTPVGYMT